jgi:hypothetical protein
MVSKPTWIFKQQLYVGQREFHVFQNIP